MSEGATPFNADRLLAAAGACESARVDGEVVGTFYAAIVRKGADPEHALSLTHHWFAHVTGAAIPDPDDFDEDTTEVV